MGESLKGAWAPTSTHSNGFHAFVPCGFLLLAVAVRVREHTRHESPTG
jgi:hypothetical protein